MSISRDYWHRAWQDTTIDNLETAISNRDIRTLIWHFVYLDRRFIFNRLHLFISPFTPEEISFVTRLFTPYNARHQHNSDQSGVISRLYSSTTTAHTHQCIRFSCLFSSLDPPWNKLRRPSHWPVNRFEFPRTITHAFLFRCVNSYLLSQPSRDRNHDDPLSSKRKDSDARCIRSDRQR